jgi:glycosyltransferase involved in cell wall biosynthesis
VRQASEQQGTGPSRLPDPAEISRAELSPAEAGRSELGVSQFGPDQGGPEDLGPADVARNVGRDMKVAVVIPAYQVEREITATLEGIPAWVERILVVDDASTDSTSQRVQASVDPRVRLIRHPKNRGVGAAIVTGYEAALEADADILVVMAGDNQMCPTDLEAVIGPIRTRQADYVKGNRLVHPEWRKMPLLRRWGTAYLARWTGLLSGLRIGDSQCGYTAISSNLARRIPLLETWPRYGYPGHLLLTISFAGGKVAEVPVRPVYRGERSGLRPYHVLWISLLVLGRALELLLRGTRTRGTPKSRHANALLS